MLMMIGQSKHNSERRHTNVTRPKNIGWILNCWLKMKLNIQCIMSSIVSSNFDERSCQHHHQQCGQNGIFALFHIRFHWNLRIRNRNVWHPNFYPNRSTILLISEFSTSQLSFSPPEHQLNRFWMHTNGDRFASIRTQQLISRNIVNLVLWTRWTVCELSKEEESIWPFTKKKKKKK